MDDKAQRKNKKIIVIVLIVAIVIGALCGVLLGKWISNTAFDSALVDVQTVIRNEYKNNCSITTSDHTVFIEIWNDGMTEIAVEASNGNDSASAIWDNVIHDVGDLAQSISGRFSALSGATVYLSLMNDENPERKLISYKDKLLIYDVVSSYNIGG